MWSTKVCLYLPNIAQKNNIFVTHYTYYPMKWPLIWTSSSENALFLGDLMTKCEIAALANCSESTVYNVLHLHCMLSTVTNPYHQQ